MSDELRIAGQHGAIAPDRRSRRRASALGTITDTVSARPRSETKRRKPGVGGQLPLEEKARQARLRRWELQNHAARLLPGERVAECKRRVAFMVDRVEIRYRPEAGRAYYNGLQRCDSVWHCPICAAKISEGRRDELAALNLKHLAASEGNSTWMTTFTVKHNRHDDLGDLLNRFLMARRKMRQGRRGMALRGDFGVIGTVSVLEVTWSKENGWHPHVHELVFSTDPNFDPERYDQVARGAWRDALKTVGLKMNGHGFKIDRTYGAVADYIAKFGHEPMSDRPWGVEDEVTKGHTKRGRVDRHYTPFQLLDAIADGHEELEPRWQEYARWFKGRKQLNFSPGLKARYQQEEMSDEEIAVQGEQEEAPMLTDLTQGQWGTVVEHNVRGAVIELASTGRIGELIEGLAEIGIEAEPGMQRGWRVQTPAGPGEVQTVLNEVHRGRWRCTVRLDESESGRRWRAFDLVEVIVLRGPPCLIGERNGKAEQKAETAER